MKFIDWFAGIGGFRRGMELAGHECVGFCEYNKFAVMSYTSMHLITEEQRERLVALDLWERQKEILKSEYRNGEWFADDIRRVYAGDIPKADCWCFGFPCQDISIAGKQAGFTGNRSSLFFRVMYLLGRLPEEEKPTFLFIENVRNLLSVNGGWDFARLLVEMDRGGYDAEWQVLNTKDFGIPQNRERCFIVGHLRGRTGREIFPVGSRRESSAELPGHDSDQVISNTLRVGSNQDTIGIYVIEGGGFVKVNGYHKAKQTREHPEGMRLRRLTPRECFRLQGWEEEYFNRAQFVNSIDQLYVQAGNGVTVPVIKAIAERMVM